MKRPTIPTWFEGKNEIRKLSPFSGVVSCFHGRKRIFGGRFGAREGVYKILYPLTPFSGKPWHVWILPQKSIA